MQLVSMASGEPLARSRRVFTWASHLERYKRDHIEGRFHTNGGIQKRREDGPGKRDGDQGKDIRWDTVYGNEGVDPLTDGRQRSRGIPVEIRNLIQGEPTRGVSVCVGGATVNSRKMESALCA